LGSIYVNYGVTALITTFGFVWLRFGLEFEGPAVLMGFSAFCVLFPIVFFRHARSLWLVLDCVFDSSALEDRIDVASRSEHPPTADAGP
jgi:hypothetical protein